MDEGSRIPIVASLRLEQVGSQYTESIARQARVDAAGFLPGSKKSVDFGKGAGLRAEPDDRGR